MEKIDPKQTARRHIQSFLSSLMRRSLTSTEEQQLVTNAEILAKEKDESTKQMIRRVLALAGFEKMQPKPKRRRTKPPKPFIDESILSAAEADIEAFEHT